jgi:hypothetical protein
MAVVVAGAGLTAVAADTSYTTDDGLSVAHPHPPAHCRKHSATHEIVALSDDILTHGFLFL